MTISQEEQGPSGWVLYVSHEGFGKWFTISNPAGRIYWLRGGVREKGGRGSFTPPDHIFQQMLDAVKRRRAKLLQGPSLVPTIHAYCEQMVLSLSTDLH